MKRPAELCQKLRRPYLDLPDITYPEYDKALMSSHCGGVGINKLGIHITKALANQPIGLQQVDPEMWQVDL